MTSFPVRLIVGLGNPGAKYSDTRHNIGFMVLDELAARWALPAWKSRFKSEYGQASYGGEKRLLLKPATYMNRSGEALHSAASYYKIETDEILVVHDDVDLGFGVMKLRLGGGDAGHKGIRSIVQHLSDKQFGRIRMGIGRPRFQEAVPDFVLNRFYPEHAKFLSEWIGIGADAVESVLDDGIDRAGNRFNRRKWFELTERV